MIDFMSKNKDNQINTIFEVKLRWCENIPGVRLF